MYCLVIRRNIFIKHSMPLSECSSALKIQKYIHLLASAVRGKSSTQAVSALCSTT